MAKRTHTYSHSYGYVIKGKVKNIFRLQRASTTTLNPSSVLINRLVEDAALFFTLLLFCGGLLKGKQRLFAAPNQFIPDYQYAFLRCRAIKI